MDSWLLEMVNHTITHPLLDIVMVGLSTVGFLFLPFIGIILLRRSQPRRSQLPRIPQLPLSHRERATQPDATAQADVGRAILWALAGSLVFTFIFYYLAMRARPQDVRLLLSMPPFPAFPSGHTAAAFATATVLLLGRAAVGPQTTLYRWFWMGGILLGAALIGYSRLYLGHHYPSDVLAGSVVGCAVGAAAFGFTASGQSGSVRWRWLLWPQVAVIFLVTQMAYMALLPWGLLEWPYADKVLHFLLFGMVAFWLNLWTNGKRVKALGMNLPLAILIPLTLALTEECLQQFSPRRTFDLIDLASDALGMYCFWWMSEWFLMQQARKALA